jgi:D-alanine-D-alanine ligase
MPKDENFYEYKSINGQTGMAIQEVCWNAYAAVKGTGYTRVDVRVDKHTGIPYVLEVNAQCGISEDENFTSIGAILKFANQSFSELIVHIINDAFARRKN